MIKKSTLVCLGILLLSALACTKKDRTCSCTETKSGTSTTHAAITQELFGVPFTLADTSFSNPVYDVRVYDRKMDKVTKSEGRSNCIDYTEPYYEKTTTSVPSSTFNMVIEVINSGDVKYDCKLR